MAESQKLPLQYGGFHSPGHEHEAVPLRSLHAP